MSDLFKQLEKSGAVPVPSQDDMYNQTVPSVYRGIAPRGDNIFTKALKGVGNFGLGIAKDVASTVVTPLDRMASVGAYGIETLLGNEQDANAILDRANQDRDVLGVPVKASATDVGGAVLQGTGDALKLASYAVAPQLGAGKTVLGAIGKGAVTGATGGAMYGAGSALGDVDTQGLGDVLQSTVTDATSGGIGGGIVGGALKVKSNLATKRAEQQASLKLINQKSLLQKESDAVTSQIDDILAPEKVNEFAKERFNFDTPEFLRDAKGNLDAGVFNELKDEVAKQVSSDIPFTGSQDMFEQFIKGKPMTEETLKSAYMNTVNNMRILDPKTSLYKMQGGKLVTDKTAKELIQNKVPIQDIQIIKSMNDSEKAITRKMLDIADNKIANPVITDRVTKPVAENLINTYDKYIVKNGQAIGKKLGEMRKNMAGVKIDVKPITDSYDNMLKELEIAKNPKTGELLFGNSRVRSSPKIVDAILKVDNEIQTLGAGKTAKNADVIAENLRQIVQDEPSVQGTYVQKLVNAIKTSTDDAIDGSIKGYKQAKKEFATNKAIQDEMESVFGGAFDPTDVNRGAELVRRLEGNASTRLQNLVDTIQSEAEKSGYKGANLKGLVRLASTLENVTGNVPSNSMEGIGSRVMQGAKAVGDIVRGDVLGAGEKISGMAKGEAVVLEPQDYVRLFRELVQ